MNGFIKNQGPKLKLTGKKYFFQAFLTWVPLELKKIKYYSFKHVNLYFQHIEGIQMRH